MSTLAVSLHRLGDLIMHAHVLKAMSLSGERDLHLLTHPFFEAIDFLFPFVKETHIFERSLCQYSIGENHFNKRWPFLHISELLATLNAKKFTSLIDLSQTETSSRWVTLIEAHEKIGVCYDPSLKSKIFCSENKFIRYLHSHARSAYHLVDLFKFSLGLSPAPLPTAASVNERESLIILQTLSSDEKKNWPLRSWKSLLWKLASDFPRHRLVILASNAEYSYLCEELNHRPATCSIHCVSMKEAFELLQQACLLITLDTAMKHLATWSRTPIIEIAVGSSSPFETGAYQDSALILKPDIPCSPCAHSSDCSQKEYLCHQAIDAESVRRATQWRLTGQCDSKFNAIYSVYQTPQGLWSMRPTFHFHEETYARRHQDPTQDHH